MDKTRHGHILPLRPLRSRLVDTILLCQSSLHASLLQIDLYASGVSGSHGMSRHVPCYARMSRTPRGLVLLVVCRLVKLLPVALRLAASSLLLLRSLVRLLGLDGKLTCLYLFRRHWHIAVEAHTVAVVEEDMLVVISVPVLLQHRGNLVGRKRLVEHLRMGDIRVVGDTSILRHLLMVGGKEQVSLIALTEITSPHGVVEVGRVLRVVVATPVEVVKLETEAPSLARIDSEESPKVVLTIDAVSRRVVVQQGDRRQGGSKVEILGLHEEVVVRIHEEEVRLLPAVDEDTRLPWRPEVAQRVILPILPRSEDGVHIHKGEGIGHGRRPVAKPLVHRPHLQSARHHLVLALDRVRPIPTVVLKTRSRPLVVGKDLLHLILGPCQHRETQESTQNGQKLLHRLITLRTHSTNLKTMAVSKMMTPVLLSERK